MNSCRYFGKGYRVFVVCFYHQRLSERSEGQKDEQKPQLDNTMLVPTTDSLAYTCSITISGNMKDRLENKSTSLLRPHIHFFQTNFYSIFQLYETTPVLKPFLQSQGWSYCGGFTVHTT